MNYDMLPWDYPHVLPYVMHTHTVPSHHTDQDIDVEGGRLVYNVYERMVKYDGQVPRRQHRFIGKVHVRQPRNVVHSVMWRRRHVSDVVRNVNHDHDRVVVRMVNGGGDVSRKSQRVNDDLKVEVMNFMMERIRAVEMVLKWEELAVVTGEVEVNVVRIPMMRKVEGLVVSLCHEN